MKSRCLTFNRLMPAVQIECKPQQRLSLVPLANHFTDIVQNWFKERIRVSFIEYFFTGQARFLNQYYSKHAKTVKSSLLYDSNKFRQFRQYISYRRASFDTKPRTPMANDRSFRYHKYVYWIFMLKLKWFSYEYMMNNEWQLPMPLMVKGSLMWRRCIIGYTEMPCTYMSHSHLWNIWRKTANMKSVSLRAFILWKLYIANACCQIVWQTIC